MCFLWLVVIWFVVKLAFHIRFIVNTRDVTLQPLFFYISVSFVDYNLYFNGIWWPYFQQVLQDLLDYISWQIFFKLYTHYSIIRGFKSEETMTDFSFLAKLFLNLKRQRTPCLKRVHKSKRTYRLRATIEMWRKLSGSRHTLRLQVHTHLRRLTLLA